MGTKFIILSAGKGERLRPYTNKIPKCLVKIGGKAILEWQLMVIRKLSSLKNINIVTGYESTSIQSRLPEVVNRYHNFYYDITNMVYSLFCARDLFTQHNDDLIIIYGDILFDYEVLKKIIEENVTEISLISLLEFYKLWSLRMDDPIKDIESFKIDKQSILYELGATVTDISDVHGQFTGLIKIKKEYLYKFIREWDNIKVDNKNSMFMTEFLQNLITNNWKIKAIPIKKGWLEIDTVSDVDLYEKLISLGIINDYINIFNSKK